MMPHLPPATFHPWVALGPASGAELSSKAV